jgi:hypothetical protein
VPFAEDENMIQPLAPDRTAETLGKGILQGAVRRREDFVDPHALHYSVPKRLAVDLVTSTICWAIQRALGCSVKLKWTTREAGPPARPEA